MFTRNYYNWQEFYQKNFDKLGSTYSSIASIGVVNLSGIAFDVQVWQGNNIQQKLQNASYLMNVEIRLGTGNTAATTSDYNLENDITSSLNMSTYVAGNASNDGIHVVFTIGGTNTTSSDVVIKEIGFIKNFYISTNTNTTPSLFNRTVLDTPETIEAGENFSFVYELILR